MGYNESVGLIQHFDFLSKFIYFNKYMLCIFSSKNCTVTQLKNRLKIQCVRNSNEIKMTTEQGL
jgi:hypothetical protein